MSDSEQEITVIEKKLEQFHDENVTELDNILHDYKNKLIDNNELIDSLEDMIYNIKNQAMKIKSQTIHSTYNYNKTNYNKEEFYKFFERLLVEENDSADHMLNTGILRNHYMSINIKSDNTIIECCIKGEMGDLIIETNDTIIESNSDTDSDDPSTKKIYYYPFTKKIENINNDNECRYFSIEILEDFLKEIKKNINSDTKIVLGITDVKYIEVDNEVPLFWISYLFKKWITFFIEECNVSKDNLSIKITESDCDYSDYEITYKVQVV